MTLRFDLRDQDLVDRQIEQLGVLTRSPRARSRSAAWASSPGTLPPVSGIFSSWFPPLTFFLRSRLLTSIYNGSERKRHATGTPLPPHTKVAKTKPIFRPTSLFGFKHIRKITPVTNMPQRTQFEANFGFQLASPAPFLKQDFTI